MEECKIIVMSRTFEIVNNQSKEYLMTNFEIRETETGIQYLISK